MRYAIFDLELNAPISALSVSPGDVGVAVLVRRNGVPLGFWMQRTGSSGIGIEELSHRIASVVGARPIGSAVPDEPPATTGDAVPSLTIAICTRDRPEEVARLIQSLRPVLDRRIHGIERPSLIVVDNAPSDDRTRDLIARTEGARYVRELRPGLDFARNRALQETATPFLAFLDDDVVVDRYWLEGFVAVLSDHPDAVAVTGQVLPLELESEAQIICEERGGFRRGFERIRYGSILPNSPLYPGGAGIFGAGANMAFRVAAVREIGGFDESLDTGPAVPGGGDLDMFYRVIRKGHVLVYEPRFLVFHQHRREMAALSRQYRRSWGFGFMCYLTKCLMSDPERRWPLLRLVAWWFKHHLREVVRRIIGVVPGDYPVPASMLVGELWGGVIGLLGAYRRSQRRTARIRQRFS